MDSLPESISRALNEITEKGILTIEQLEKRVINCIKELSENESLHVLECFSSTDLTAVEDKEQFLYESFLDHVNSNKKPESLLIYLTTDIKDISELPKIMELLERTRYTLTVSSGQRRYGGPPPHWDGPPPGCGDVKFYSQVHIGKLGPKVFEDTLVPILETCGRVYQLRIMINTPTGENKGYAFVDFFTNEEAEKFVETYNGKTIGSDTNPITAKLTVPNCKLFVGGFPTGRSKEEVEREFKKLFDPISIEVKAFSGSNNRRRNRGFVFVTFPTHDEANKARKKLEKGTIKVFNHVVSDVEWAEGNEMPDEVDVKPKVLYIRYGSAKVDESVLRDLFKEFGEIKSVDVFSEYAFVEFLNEEDATKALSINGHKIGDTLLAVSNAKVKKAQTVQKLKNRRKMKFRGRESRYKNRTMDLVHDVREQDRENRARYPLDYYPSHERHPRHAPHRLPPHHSFYPPIGHQMDDYSYEYNRGAPIPEYRGGSREFGFDPHYGYPQSFSPRREDSHYTRGDNFAPRGSRWVPRVAPQPVIPNYSVTAHSSSDDRPRYPVSAQIHRHPIPPTQQSTAYSSSNYNRQQPQTAPTGYGQQVRPIQPGSMYPQSVDKSRYPSSGNVEQFSQPKQPSFNPNFNERPGYQDSGDANQSFAPNQHSSMYLPNQDQPRYPNPTSFGQSFTQSPNIFRSTLTEDPRNTADGPYSNIDVPKPTSAIRYW